MSFETFNYAQKRVRSIGSREWKLWFSETEAGLAFRLLTKDSKTDCYVTLQGVAALVEGETAIQDDDNGDAYPTDLYTFKDGQGTVAIYLELDEQGLAWVTASGAYGKDDCSFQAPGPLMPEVAG
ncbi:MAG TPA: hypothetical protein VHS96_10545 [Bacteroidia bacterium]|nr:hypothetical protein [Bacteroidia bacterium]